jgi:hypothetical protein
MKIHTRSLEEQKFSLKATFNIRGRTDQNIYNSRTKIPRKSANMKETPQKSTSGALSGSYTHTNMDCTFTILFIIREELRRKQICSTLRYNVTFVLRGRKIIKMSVSTDSSLA